jgi:hypothetical protein
MTNRRILGLTLALLAALVLPGQASARQVHLYHYTGNSFSAGAAEPKAIAFDEANQRVLIVSSSGEIARVSVFTAAGLTAPFTGVGGAPSITLPSETEFSSTSVFAIATDASTGNFYVSTTQPSRLYGYAYDGVPLPGFPVSFLNGDTCGVGVDPAGGVWLADPHLGSYREYTSTGTLTGKALAFGRNSGGCTVRYDSAGNSYAAKGSRLIKSDAAGKLIADLGAIVPANSGAVAGGRNPLIALDRSLDSLLVLGRQGAGNLVTELDDSGTPLADFGGPDPSHFAYPGLQGALDVAVNPVTHDVYALRQGSVDVFAREASPTTVPTVTTEPVSDVSATTVTLRGTVDPDGVATSDCRFEWGESADYGDTVPCSEGHVFGGGAGKVEVSAVLGGLQKGFEYHARLVVSNTPGGRGLGRDVVFNAADPPQIDSVGIRGVTTDSAQVHFDLSPNGAPASYHVEISGPGGTVNQPDPDAPPQITADVFELNYKASDTNLKTQAKTQSIANLEPETPYEFRVVATNPAGVTKGPFRRFITFPSTQQSDDCPNAHVRQQTSAALLFDCRAYELVSAPDTGGYDVRSELSSGVVPLSTSPDAADQVLYSMRSGTIPGIPGNPTNRGADPYVATRGSDGWSTKYVGVPADAPSLTPFSSSSSGMDAGLDTFSFGGSDSCDPCFADGSAGIPLRMPDGSLIQGMSGPVPVTNPVSSGNVHEPLSADGTDFVFASKQLFVAGANDNNSDVTIYDRDLIANTTQIVSTTPGGTPIANGAGVTQLDISSDGSRMVIGRLISTDSAGNPYYQLYMHVGSSPNSIDLTPGATSGVLYGGMTSDGQSVYFTARDPLTTAENQDHDSSADLYRADVDGGAATLARVSIGEPGSGDTDLCDPVGNSRGENWNALKNAPTDCSVRTVGGGGGVADDGTVYFLSPEQLETAGSVQPVPNAPNLYVSRPGSAPRFVATLESILNGPQPPATVLAFQKNIGSFVSLNGIAVDGAKGHLYVLENSLNRVRKFDTAGTVVKFTAGPANNTNVLKGSDAPTGAFSQSLERPVQIAVDSSTGDLFVPDYNHNVVDVFKSTGAYDRQLPVGTPSGVAIQPGTGKVYASNFSERLVEIFSSSGTLLDSISTFGNPLGLAVDSAGTVYVITSSVLGLRVWMYNAAGANQGMLLEEEVSGLSLDPSNDDLYVDLGDRILQLDSSGKPVGGSDGAGGPIGVGDLTGSTALAFDSGKIYAANQSGAKIAVIGPVLKASLAIDNPLVVNAVFAAGTRHSEDFQVTSDGDLAVFSTALPLTGVDTNEKYEIYRYDTEAGDLECVSCIPTEATPETHTSLSAHGLNLLDDGRVFFTSGEPLALRDANERRDAYEWSDGVLQLISTGTSETDSTFLSASADGTDAFFFTRQQIVPSDRNGSAVRLYTARENGGFSYGPPEFQCAASDECHGPGTEAAPPASIPTATSTPAQHRAQKACKRRFVRRNGRCVAKKQRGGRKGNRGSRHRGAHR